MAKVNDNKKKYLVYIIEQMVLNGQDISPLICKPLSYFDEKKLKARYLKENK